MYVCSISCYQLCDVFEFEFELELELELYDDIVFVQFLSCSRAQVL